LASDPDTKSIEVGVKVRADVSGFITGIRFYKSSNNSGTHVAHLWTATGILLTSATFIDESASGWQQVKFATPVAITAGTTYVASYHTDVGHYAGDVGYFAPKGVDRGAVHALQDGADGGNGVYVYGPNASFPINSWKASNYWVDIVFATTPVTCPCNIWPPSAAPINAGFPDSSSIEVGVKFRSDVNGLITGIRFYKSTSNTGTHVGSLWGADGTQLAQATFTNESSSGWQQVNFAVPIAISAGTTYIASYHANVGHYAGDNGYFAIGGVDNGPLHALKDGVNGGNGVYAYSASSTFPNSTYKSSNYWVDVVFKSQ